MNETKLNQLKDRFKPGLVFHMSKIVFADNMNQQYNSTPKTEVVSMLSTTWSPVLVSAGKPKIPEPAIPIVQSMGIEREQHFDALALIQDVSASSNGGNTLTGQARVRCQILLNDGSLNEDTGKVCHLPVTIFADAMRDLQEPLLFKKLRSAAEGNTAMAFLVSRGSNRRRSNRAPALASGLSRPPLDSSARAQAIPAGARSWKPKRSSLL